MQLIGKIPTTAQRAFRATQQGVFAYDIAKDVLSAKGSPLKFGGKLAGRVAFSLVATSLYIVFAAGAFDNWKHMRLADRGTTILQSIRATGQLLEQGGQMWKSIAVFRNFQTDAELLAMRFESTAIAAGEIQGEKIATELAQLDGFDHLRKLQNNHVLR
ncbi:hypothetical protein BGZ63DRAFT_423335 [Mariannaea sp. PMI_226]|nr:hypothetical protein BGZ63DRAFT_423335 [Mariannaea sp. PMI_226]